MDEINVRPGGERDYQSIARIQQACPEAAQWPVGDYSNFLLLIAASGAGIGGFCAWRQTSPGEAELLNLGIDPSCRRKGFASALLKALARTATGEVYLEVAEDNTAALALYRKLGWEQIAIRRGYYHNGQTNAVVMKKGSW